MSATVFQRLLYTDCRPGEGRGGGPGFQIQAQSAGVTADLARFAVATMLYVAPAEWLAARAVEDFPLGFTHAAAAGGWGTAQSRYLGKEVNGSRPGNHLADCLLTTDRGPYGSIRPAQLLQADVWRDVPFETPDCPPYEGFLQPGPLTNDHLQAWLREDGTRVEVLGRLLTALEDPKGAQVVVVAVATEDAVRWIAAATVLLPIAAALDISFKVFVTDLDRSPQRIVGVSKELNPGLAPVSAGRRFLLDATSGVAGDGCTSERADYWIAKFVEADDPYEVVEAVDFADLLAGDRGGDTPESCAVAWSIVAEAEPIGDPTPIVDWLRRPNGPEMGEHESAAAGRLIASGVLDLGTLVWMEQEADADRLYVDRVQLRQALMAAEIEENDAARIDWYAQLTPVDVGEGPRRDAESAISSALLLTGDGDSVDRLLRIALRHQVPLAVAPLEERLDAFVGDWIAEPARHYDPGKWALSEHLIGELVRQLLAATDGSDLALPDYARMHPLLEATWPYLLRQVTNPLDPLTWELAAASISSTPAGAKERELERAMANFQGCADSTGAIAGFQAALVRWRALSPDDAMAFVGLLPREVMLRQEVADEAATAISRRRAAPDARLLDALRVLDERRQIRFSSPTEDLASSDRTLTAFINTVRWIRSIDELGQVSDLKKVDPRVFAVRAERLVDLTLEPEVLPLLGGGILATLTDGQAAAFTAAWGRRLGTEVGTTAAARGYLWSEASKAKIPDPQRRQIAELIGARAESLQGPEKAVWLGEVESLLGPEAAELQAFLKSGGRRSRIHLGRSQRD